MKIPIGAEVEVRYSDGGLNCTGWYLGNSTNGHIVYRDDYEAHPVFNVREEFVGIRGSWAIRPLTTGMPSVNSVASAALDFIFGDRGTDSRERETAVPKGHESYWRDDVPVVMAPEEYWTNNFTRGEKVEVSNGGRMNTCTVITEFRNHVVYQYPVGSVSASHVDELQKTGILAQSPTDLHRKMSSIADAVAEWQADPNMLRNSLLTIERIIKS